MKQIVVKIVIPETEYRGWDRGSIISDLESDLRVAIRGQSIKNYDLEIVEEEV
jgi:hypothetical protein